jgi:hypothetical protein
MWEMPAMRGLGGAAFAEERKLAAKARSAIARELAGI